MLSDEQKANVRKWIEALRSGEYQQGRNFLCADSKYCCLGVACDLYQKIGPGDMPVHVEWSGKVQFDGEIGTAPQKVMEWLGLGDEQGIHSYSNGGVPNYLTELNDEDCFSFTEIADVIEKAIDDPVSPLFDNDQ